MAKPYSHSAGSGINFFTKNWDQTNPGTTNLTSVGWTDTADGICNPYWKDQIAQNKSATTPFSAKSTTVTHEDGYLVFDGYVTALGNVPSARRLSGMSGCLHTSNYVNFLPSNVDSVNAAESTAASKFYNTASGILKALEGGELIGETHKTAQAIIQKTTQVVGLLTGWRKRWNTFRSSHRKGNREASLKRALAFASDNYLEWKFGVDPLVKDVQSLAGSMRDDFIDVETFTSNGKGSGPGLIATETAFQPTGSLITAYANVSSIESVSVRYKAAIVLRRYGVGGLAERVGLSPANFVPTIYNLLPWTWLLDYVTNVGDIVTAICFDPMRIAWCVKTVKRELITTKYAGASPQISIGLTPYPGYPIVKPSITRWQTKLVNRTDERPPLIPSFSTRLPDFQTEAGRSKWLNVAAVLSSQAFGKSILKSVGVTNE
jgi:hypothetical protein